MTLTEINDLETVEEFPVLFVNPKMKFWPVVVGYYDPDISNCWKTDKGREITPTAYKEFYKVEF